MSPISVMTTDTAAAKIGRSMKKCEKRTALRAQRPPPPLGSPGSDSVLFSPRETPVGNAAHRAFRHRDPAARARALHAADDRRGPAARAPRGSRASRRSAGPGRTTFWPTTPSASTTYTTWRVWSVTMAWSGTSSASNGCVANSRSWPNMPGEMKPSGLSTTARSADRARAAVERVVEEVDAALPAIFGLVLQADVDAARAARRPPRACT